MAGESVHQEAAESQERRRAGLAERADTLEGMAQINIENGLFAQTDDIDQLVEALYEARNQISLDALAGAASSLTRGEHLLHRVLYKEGKFWWRLGHVHQVPLFVYYVVSLLCILNIGSGYWAFIADEIWSMPTAALGVGALGAILRGLWWLYRNVARRKFRMSFLLAHLAAPWIGALFGLFTYLLLLAGVVSLEGAEQADLQGGVLHLALAFLAGYSWEWVLDRVDRLRGKTNRDEQPPTPKSQGKGDGRERTPK